MNFLHIYFVTDYSIIVFTICCLSFFIPIIVSLLFNKQKVSFIWTFGIVMSGLLFVLTLLLLILYTSSDGPFQFNFVITINTLIERQIFFGVDGISLSFLILTSFLIFLCVVYLSGSMDLKIYNSCNAILICLFFLEFFLFCSFICLDYTIFFFFFECALIPTYFVIGIWGSRQQKIKAAYMFFMYTLVGSVFLFYGVGYLYTMASGSTNIFMLYSLSIDQETQIFFATIFFIAFAVKVPMIPLHIWLPEAHVEAPTVGSVLLAGILLKLGGYGIIRFLIPIFPEGVIYITPYIYMLGTLGIIYTSLMALRQVDIKKMVAYSSIAHMNGIILALFSGTVCGIQGGIFLMIGHGLVSAALFFCIGIIYDRYKTRLIKHYSGLAISMPNFASFFFFFLFANASFPGTASFIGEVLICLGIGQISFLALFVMLSGSFLTTCNSLWLASRMLFGQINVVFLDSYRDINYEEFFILTCLGCSIIFLGLAPNFLLQLTEMSTILIIEKISFFL